MKISDIDKNLTVCGTIPNDVEWLDIFSEPFILYGITADEEGFCRLPSELARSVSEGLFFLSRNTAGGRLRFKTDSPYVAVKAHFKEAYPMPHMAFINSGGFDIYENTSHTSRYIGSYKAPVNMYENAFAGIVDTGGGMKDLTLNFPSYGSPDYIEIGLKSGCRLEKTDGYCNSAPILFYGSSITQGGCASRPGIIYENYVSRRFNIDYINLGFSGNGLAEDEIVDYMAGLDFSVFVSDYDHNAPTPEYLRDTHYRMYERIRAAKPTVPYIMLSKPDFDNDTNAPLRRDIIMESYRRARENGDRFVYFIDGETLFGGEDRDNCTVDGCHPNDLGMYRFAAVLIDQLDKIL